MAIAEPQSIRTDVELIKKDVSSISVILNKLDTSIEKMTVLSSDITKMLLIHDSKFQNHDQQLDSIKLVMTERKDDFEKQTGALYTQITDLKVDIHREREKYHSELMAAINKLGDSHESLEKRISKLENWRWLMAGGGLVIGFLISTIPWAVIIRSSP